MHRTLCDAEDVGDRPLRYVIFVEAYDEVVGGRVRLDDLMPKFDQQPSLVVGDRTDLMSVPADRPIVGRPTHGTSRPPAHRRRGTRW